MSTILSEIVKEGFIVTRCERSELDATLLTLGPVIQRERVVLREGGHAYLSKPGRVPLHTDHPQAQLIAWFCEEQDPDDGANHLLDSRPVVRGLSESNRRTLRMTQLECPPVGRGPVEAHGVLTADGVHDSLFCSPWLRAVGNDPSHQTALDELKSSLQQRAASHLIKVRLRRGELLIIDNGRMLHGRGELRTDSKRELLRAWIRRRS